MSTASKCLGAVEFSGKVVVSDPCYDRGTWCAQTDFPVKPGRYQVHATFSDEGGFGLRVAALAFYHEDFMQQALWMEWQEACTNIGVDSGQCGVFDDTIYPQSKDHPDNQPFYEDQQAYGYYTNPNAFWDWFLIGGRWPFQFLVKEGCDSAVYAEKCWGNEKATRSAPEGYCWVAGARKRDIEWDIMRAHRVDALSKRLPVLEQWFRSGVRPADGDLFAEVTEEGIRSWGHMLYIKDETLEQYLERHDLGPGCKYPIYAFSYVQEGTYYSHGDMGWWGISSNDKPDDVWRSMTQDFLAHVPEDDFLVSLDCHI